MLSSQADKHDFQAKMCGKCLCDRAKRMEGKEKLPKWFVERGRR
jgi:hypothetical protein